MTKQTKRKGKIKMKTYYVGDVVEFQGDDYTVVEILLEGSMIHIKKTTAPFNTMVVPVHKIGEKNYAEYVKAEVLDSEGKFDLLYRPDDRITLAGASVPKVENIFSENQKSNTEGDLGGY